jgi:hypothetical protein
MADVSHVADGHGQSRALGAGDGRVRAGGRGGGGLEVEAAADDLLHDLGGAAENPTGAGAAPSGAREVEQHPSSAGVAGAAILRPGMVSAQFSTAWECCAPKPRPPPFAVRTTSGTVTWPPVMYRILAARPGRDRARPARSA